MKPLLIVVLLLCGCATPPPAPKPPATLDKFGFPVIPDEDVIVKP